MFSLGGRIMSNFFSFLYFPYFPQFLNEYIYIPRNKGPNKFLKIHHLNTLKLLNEIYTGLFKLFLSFFPKKQQQKKQTKPSPSPSVDCPELQTYKQKTKTPQDLF